MRRSPRSPTSPALGFAGTLAVHGAAVLALIAASGARVRLPPTYAVHLVAAPDVAVDEKRAPDAVTRPAAEQPAPAVKTKPAPKNTASTAPPPPNQDQTPREAAPRTTPKAPRLPGEAASTGNDVATVSTEGIQFPFPEYLSNIQSQVLRRWRRSTESYYAEVSFFIHRDGSVTGIDFVKRSGNFGFDLDAEGTVEEAGRIKAFGPLPDGWPSDVLFVRFFFAPRQP
jgi:outer membrane biosynthesis protein TonB